jgi:hypothetical protein
VLGVLGVLLGLLLGLGLLFG